MFCVSYSYSSLGGVFTLSVLKFQFAVSLMVHLQILAAAVVAQVIVIPALECSVNLLSANVTSFLPVILNLVGLARHVSSLNILMVKNITDV
tara:strand:- start:283 stop:558 length:276 start_codon:yes stop_codon:yes gene_type:complete